MKKIKPTIYIAQEKQRPKELQGVLYNNCWIKIESQNTTKNNKLITKPKALMQIAVMRWL